MLLILTGNQIKTHCVISEKKNLIVNLKEKDERAEQLIPWD